MLRCISGVQLPDWDRCTGVSLLVYGFFMFGVRVLRDVRVCKVSDVRVYSLFVAFALLLCLGYKKKNRLSTTCSFCGVSTCY